MAERIETACFRDPSLAAPVAISLTTNELFVLSGPAGPWMHGLASNLAGLGPRNCRNGTPGRIVSTRCLVLLRPPFFDPGRDVEHQIENRLGTFGLSASAAREQVPAWCEAEGLSNESRQKAGSLPEGLLVYFSLAVPCLAQPSALVVEDPLTGMSADLAGRAVRLLCDLSKGRPVLVICADPVRFEGSARIEVVAGVGGTR